mmetsp:Transcript_46934/g.115048  ORF Transcript_46934/g.115048 Transcript_46934/m.115048 type:complete len:218 (-) Transcript_46934:61-714(-)
MVAAAAAHADEDHDRDAHDVQHCNMQVVNVSTPAQYFHVLRRQVHRRFRKPLVVFAPKSLLKHRHAVSTLDDFCATRRFQPVLGDAHTRDAADRVRRIVLCTGKLYYDLAERRAALDDELAARVALVRIEQLAPFPRVAVAAEIARYANAHGDIVWAQEESFNMGYYTYLYFFFKSMGVDARFVGRRASAAPATGSAVKHELQQRAVVDACFADVAP